MRAASELQAAELSAATYYPSSLQTERIASDGGGTFLHFMENYVPHRGLSSQDIKELSRINQYSFIIPEELKSKQKQSLEYLNPSLRIGRRLAERMIAGKVGAAEFSAFETIWKYTRGRDYFELFLAQQILRADLYSVIIKQLGQAKNVDEKLISLFERCRSTQFHKCFPSMYQGILAQESGRQTSDSIRSSIFGEWVKNVPRYREANECRVHQAFANLARDYRESFPEIPRAITEFDQKRQLTTASWNLFAQSATPLEGAYIQSQSLDQVERMIRAALLIKSEKSSTVTLKDFDLKSVRLVSKPSGWLLYSVGPDRIDDKGNYALPLQGIRAKVRGDLVIQIEKSTP
jgi:hypothetical protein